MPYSETYFVGGERMCTFFSSENGIFFSNSVEKRLHNLLFHKK